MNTKQVEERTGISRQNIRYYEKVELLTPARTKENSYREYSEKDIERLNMIKFLRMLDMPIEDITKVFHGEVSMEDAVALQQKELQLRQKQLQGAIEICERIRKDAKKDTSEFSVDEYLAQIEYEQNKIGGFAQFKDDYKKIVMADKQKQFSYLVTYPIHTEQELFDALKEATNDEWEQQKGNDKLTVMRKGTTYIVTKKKMRGKNGLEQSTLIIGNMVHPELAIDAQIPHVRKKRLYVMHMIIRNIIRNKWKSLLTCGISMMAVLLITIYFGNISNLKEQLALLPNTMPVEGTVYNSCGSKSKGILIPEDMIAKIQQSEYVSDYYEEIELLGSVTTAENASPFRVLATNQVKEDCLVEETFLKNHNLKVGDSIEVHFDTYVTNNDPYMKYRNLLLEPLKDTQITITGTFQSTDLSEDNETMQMMIPLETVKKWYSENEMRYFAGSVHFDVKNLTKLNDFKEELKKEKILEVDSTKDDLYLGEAITLDDGEYIQSASKVTRSLELLQTFYPLILLVVFVSGMIVSYLMIQSRRIELAIMRMLGSGKQKTGSMILMEQMILTLLGCVLGILIGLMFHFQIMLAEWGTIGLYAICYLIGSIISIGTVDSNHINSELTQKG